MLQAAMLAPRKGTVVLVAADLLAGGLRSEMQARREGPLAWSLPASIRSTLLRTDGLRIYLGREIW